MFEPEYRQCDIQQLYDDRDAPAKSKREAVQRVLEWLVELHNRLDKLEKEK